MSVIKKLVTLLRGSAREIGQSVVDSNATRIYERKSSTPRPASPKPSPNSPP